MTDNPFDTRRDRTTAVERRGLIALALTVCITILAIAAWRSDMAKDTRDEEPVAESLVEEVSEPYDTVAANDRQKPASTNKRHNKRKTTHKRAKAVPPLPRESPLNRPL